MKSLVAKAAKGSRAARQQLYTQYRTDAYFLASQLLQHDDKSIVAVTDAFADVMNRDRLSRFADDDAFARALETAVAISCRTQLTKLNSKALRLPQDRRFDIRELPADADGTNESVFRVFTDLQRWIFVLRNASSLDEKDVCAVIKTDARTLQDAVHAEAQNFMLLLPDTSYDAFVKDFIGKKETLTIPSELDAAMQPILTPVLSAEEQKKKTQKMWIAIGSIAAGVVLAALAGVATWDIATGGNLISNEPTTTTNAVQATVGTKTSVTATHYADIDIKDHGTITVALDSMTAPETVTNFLMLADSGFYDGLTFHRIMEGFMMQGGDPKGDGTGGSDKEITGEFASNGIENPLSHVRGAISMARSNNPNSGSSQFFIVHEDSTFLDGNYAAFGYVTEGMDIVDKICTEAAPTDDNGTIPADKQPIINTITVRTAV